MTLEEYAVEVAGELAAQAALLWELLGNPLRAG
jgi:hypothetical protein